MSSFRGLRAGRRPGIAVPTLTQLRQSILVVDPRGELAAITTLRRCRRGQSDQVAIFDPFNILKNGRTAR